MNGVHVVTIQDFERQYASARAANHCRPIISLSSSLVRVGKSEDFMGDRANAANALIRIQSRLRNSKEIACMSSPILEQLCQAVIDGDVDKVNQLCREALQRGIDPLEAISKGLARGAKELGDRFGRGEVFLVDLMLAGEAMKAGTAMLLPNVKEASTRRQSLGKVLMGTVKGDIHSIGKDIVATLTEAEGFEVENIGEDIPEGTFVGKVKEHKPSVLGLSSLMTVTMPAQREVIKLLENDALRSQVKVIVGGAPTSQNWADEIGADGWAGDAVSASKKVRQLVGK